MFIIWGTKIKPQPRGTVADQCPVCMEVQCFAVTDHYEFDHLYFISVGHGRRVASTRRCSQCGNDFGCTVDGYTEYLPDAKAEALSLDEIVDRTNAPLAEIRAVRKSIAKMASERPAALAENAATQVMLPGTPLRDVPAAVQDAELRETLGRLEAYEGTVPEVTGLLQKLQNWRNLDNVGRSVLLQEADDFIDNRQKRDRAFTFLDRMVGSYPRHLGWFPAAGVAAVLGAATWWAYLYTHPCVVCTFGAVAIGAVIACYHFVTSSLRRRWMRDTVIPLAVNAGVDLKTLAAVMTDVSKLGDRIDGKMEEMTSEVWLLEQEAVALGHRAKPPEETPARQSLIELGADSKNHVSHER